VNSVYPDILADDGADGERIDYQQRSDGQTIVTLKKRAGAGDAEKGSRSRPEEGAEASDVERTLGHVAAAVFEYASSGWLRLISRRQAQEDHPSLSFLTTRFKSNQSLSSRRRSCWESFKVGGTTCYELLRSI